MKRIYIKNAVLVNEGQQIKGSIVIENDWSAEGYASLAGRHALSDQPAFATANATKQPVVVADVSAASPDEHPPRAKGDAGIGSLVVIAQCGPWCDSS